MRALAISILMLCGCATCPAPSAASPTPVARVESVTPTADTPVTTPSLASPRSLPERDAAAPPGLRCGADGALVDEGPTARGEHRLLFSADRRSAVLAGRIATVPIGIVVTCRSGQLIAREFHRDTFHGDGVDASRIHPGLNQMSWYRFTPSGHRLVFAVTGHSRRPNPHGTPRFDVETLVSKFVVIDLDAFTYTEIDTREYGYDSYTLSDEHIVFRAAGANYRSDFSGNVVRLPHEHGARPGPTPVIGSVPASPPDVDGGTRPRDHGDDRRAPRRDRR